MARRRHVERAARAVSDHARRARETDAREPTYAEVVDVDPLACELHGSRLELTDEKLELTQWVKRYDLDHTIDIGDTLVVHRMPNDDWLVTDVVSDKELA